MYRVDKGDQFPILVQLVNEPTGELATGETVYYDIRHASDDSVLVPTVSGTLIESTVEQGLYKNVESVSESGQYIIYATCNNFITNSEELIVNPESIYDLTKQYNVFVEDVTRTNVTPTASQTVRNVPLGETDFIINKIKKSSETDWAFATISGTAWAWYRSVTDALPYRMGPEV